MNNNLKYSIVLLGFILIVLILTACPNAPVTTGGGGGSGSSSSSTNEWPVVTVGPYTNGQVVSASYTIAGEIIDDKTGCAVYVKLDNGAFATGALDTPTNWHQNVTLLTKGFHTNYVYAVDSDSCYSPTNMLVVNYYSDIPEVAFSNVANLCVTNYSTIDLYGSATVDAPGYIVKVELSVNGAAFVDVGNTNWTATGIALTVGATNLLQLRAISDNGKTNVPLTNRVIVVSATPEVYVYSSKWSSIKGSAITRDSSGNIYLAGSTEVRKYSSSGIQLTNWGSYGTSNGQFNNLKGIAVDASGNVYVADSGNNRLQKFNSSGAFVTNWGTYGTNDNQFDAPSGLALDTAGNLYVADSGNHRVVKYASDGTFIKKWGTYGTGNGQFSVPRCVTVDGISSVYVGEQGNYRIQKFDTNGTYIRKWGSMGGGNNQFMSITGLAVDSSGNVYTTDAMTNRAQKFTPDGAFIAQWGSYGTGDGYLYSPYGIVIDTSLNVYVSDMMNNRVQVFIK